MIRAAFFDIDGTLLSHSIHGVPESAQEAVNAMKENGIKCVVSSGRSIMEYNRLPVNVLKFDGYITLNGQLIFDENQKVLFAHPIEGEARENILRLFHNKTIPLLLVEADRLYINFVNEHVEIASKAVSTPIPPVEEYKGAPIYLAIAYVPKQKEDWLKRQVPGTLITRWNPFALDIVSATGGKQAGVEEYISSLNIQPEETIAFGDGENDLEMIRHAGIGVAMGNAEQCVKDAADYITDHIDEDGLYKAAKHFGLIKEESIKD